MAWVEQRKGQHRVYWYVTAGQRRKTYEPFANSDDARLFLRLAEALGSAEAARAYLAARERDGAPSAAVAAAGLSADRPIDGVAAGRCTLAVLREGFRQARPALTERTRQDYLRDIDRYVLGYFGTDFDVTELRAQPRLVGRTAQRRDNVAGWLTWLAEQPARSCTGQPTGRRLSPKTIRNVHSLLYGMVQLAVEDEDVDLHRNPCEHSQLPVVTEPEMQFLEHRSFAAFLALFADRWRPLVLTLVMTGMRWGEAAGLQMRQLHLDAPVPYVRICKAYKRSGRGHYVLGRPKTRSSIRSVSLNAKLVAVLREHTAGLEPDDFVFTMDQGGPLKHGNFSARVWKKAVAQAVTARLVQPGFRIHDLRHTNACWLISAGRPLRTVKNRLGHEDISTTDRYTHLLVGVDLEDRAVLDAAFPELALVEPDRDDAVLALPVDDSFGPADAALPLLDIGDDDDLAA